MANNIVVPFTSDTSGLEAGAKRAADTVQSTSTRMLDLLKRQAVAQANVGKEAKASAQAVASTISTHRQLDDAITNLAKAQIQATAELRVARTAQREGTISLEEYRRKQLETRTALQLVRAEHSQAVRALQQTSATANNTRFGVQNLGFQLQDMAVQFAGGTSAARIFAQQGPQVIGAIQGMAGGTSRFATFMGGPWGVAIGVGVAALGALATKLFDTKEALDKVKFAASEVGNAQGILGGVMDMATGKITSQSKALIGLANAQLLVARVQAQARAAEARSEVRSLQDPTLRIGGGFGGGISASRTMGIEGQVSKQLLAGVIDGNTAVNKLEEMRRAGLITDQVFAKAAAAVANLGVELENLKVLDNAGKLLRGTGGTELLKPDKSTGSKETATFILPVGGSVSGRFGEQRGNRAHAGLDLAVPVGTSVKAPAGGTVIEAGTLPGYGNVVFIDHGGGTISRLAHLSRIDVVKGASVGQGESIGLSGGARGAPGAGNSQGPHLHYEVRVRGKAVDPRKGPFPVDGMGAASKAADAAQRAAAKAEREREEAVRRALELANLTANIDQEMLQAKLGLLTDQEEIARIAKEMVGIEDDKFRAGIQAKIDSKDLTEAQGLQLMYGSAIAAAMKAEKITRDELKRQVEESLKIESAANDNQRDILGLQESLAVTAAERRKIQLHILNLEKEEERRQLRKIADDRDARPEDRAGANMRLGSLEERYGLKGEAVRQSTASPLERYLQESDPKAIGERVENLVVEQLEYVQRGISDAISNALGVQDPLLRGLIDMFIEQVLIRPIAQALQGSMSGGGGLFSTLLGLGSSLIGGTGGGAGLVSAGQGASLAGLTSGGIPGFANGTDSAPGGWSWIGERGKELMFVPPRSTIIPNHKLASAMPIAAGAARNDNLPPVHISVHGEGEGRGKRATGDQIYREFRRAHAAMVRIAG